MSNKMLSGMYAAGKIAAEALEIAKEYAGIGVSTLEIDAQCQKYIESQGATAECIGFQGYKHATCISLSDVACHGVPNKNHILKDGDMINVDLVVRYKNYLADTSVTILVGNANPEVIELSYVAENVMYVGMAAAKLGGPVCNIGNAIQRYVDHINTKRLDAKQFGLIMDYVGHGIGDTMHEPPSIQHCANSNQTKLEAYKAFTVEPIVKIGKNSMLYVEPDQWTVRTKDGNPATQFEHTMAFDEYGKLHIFTTLNSAHETYILNKLANISVECI